MSAPKLRFKDFDGSWTKSTIQFFMDNNFILDQMDGNHGELYPKSEEFSSTGVPYISATDFSFGDVNFATCKRLPIERAKLFKKGIAKNGDVLFAHNATVGPVAILKTDLDFVILSTTATYYRCDATYLNNHYLKNYFESDFFVQQYFGIMSQSTRNQVPITTQRKLNIAVPNIQEQTKIASFLSVVDEKISQLAQKHGLLSQYKQGMMQKLFSQQIRFKADDGSEFGDWEETLLSEFLTESLIKGLKGNEAKKLTVKLWGKGVVPKNEAFEGSENTQYYKRFVGQLIYGKLDFLNCAFGIIPAHLDGYETTIDAPSFEINKEKANPYFLLNRFLQKDFYKKNGEEADGSRKAKRINQSVFLAMQIDLPCLEEQTKIANFLSSIDQKIEVVAQQIEQAKQWKKGLLQQMFV